MVRDAKTLLAQALEVDPATIGTTTGLETSDVWDSLAHFRIVLALEEEIGRKLSPVEILALTDYGSVVRLLEG